MTNIQILFLSALIVINIAIYFVILINEYKRDKRLKKLEEENAKIKDYCNTLFDKLKEIVVKVNPLLENAPDENVHEAKIK